MNALSPDLDALIKSFCRTNHLPACARPWTFSDGARVYVGATDGIRALFVAAPESMIDESAEARPLMLLLQAKPPPTHEVTRDDLLASIGGGRAIDWAAADCDICLGSGGAECARGHTHPCHTCGGKGYIGGHRYSRLCLHPIHIDTSATSIVDAQLLRGVFCRLPGDPVQIGLGSKGVVYFEGAGWVFCVAQLLRFPAGSARGRVRATPIRQTQEARND